MQLVEEFAGKGKRPLEEDDGQSQPASEPPEEADLDVTELTPERIEHDLQSLFIPSPYNPRRSLSEFWWAEGGRTALQRMQPVTAQILKAKKAVLEAERIRLDADQEWVSFLEELVPTSTATRPAVKVVDVPPALTSTVRRHFRFDNLTAQANEQNVLSEQYGLHDKDACWYEPQVCPASDVAFEDDEPKEQMRLLEHVFGEENLFFKRLDQEEEVMHIRVGDGKDKDAYRDRHRWYKRLRVGDVSDLLEPADVATQPGRLYRADDMRLVPNHFIHSEGSVDSRGTMCTRRYESCSDGTDRCERTASRYSDIALVVDLTLTPTNSTRTTCRGFTRNHRLTGCFWFRFIRT
ncbi:hypothetical protein M427DRAFT_145412 [Gonapodya prolifera JEL478]|uniref:Uncharacterized protein n=1 Tax=Gonapodya prolifera (strain JEL478) TaxID=1344416 RepID=A0A139AGY1_GONPJ|nr:hypothetical protein M427DRAFT_145412 [Gonapodya prolifera JEL478]|eukprot:KXS15705.1 hypothetical protein M427DRAFT_145412 [Gonapodya prolifera JEL478]